MASAFAKATADRGLRATLAKPLITHAFMASRPTNKPAKQTIPKIYPYTKGYPRKCRDPSTYSGTHCHTSDIWGTRPGNTVGNSCWQLFSLDIQRNVHILDVWRQMRRCLRRGSFQLRTYPKRLIRACIGERVETHLTLGR